MTRLLLAFFLISTPALAQQVRETSPETNYVSGIEDLPLMPGLAEPVGGTTVLDEPEGRIVEASAAGLVAPDAVVKYYASALPALGWRQTGPSAYERDGESLGLETIAQPPGATVRFSLRPAANGR